MPRKKKPWLRLYARETLASDDLKDADAATFRVWITLLCLAGLSDVRGVLLRNGEPIPVRYIARKAREDEATAEAAITYLTNCGMVGDVDDTLHIAHWDEYQFESDCSTERVAKHRASKAPSRESLKQDSSEVVAHQIQRQRTEEETEDTATTAFQQNVSGMLDKIRGFRAKGESE